MESKKRLIERYLSDHPRDAAACLERLPAQEICPVLESVQPEATSSALAALPPELGAKCLEVMAVTAALDLVGRMPEQLAAGLLRRNTATKQEELLSGLPSRKSDSLRRLLTYRENSVGALMDLEYLVFFEDTLVGDALQAPRVGSSEVYVVSRDHKVAGVTNIRELREAPANRAVGTLRHRPEATFSPNTDLSVAANDACWLKLDEAPIVARDRTLLGIVRHRALRARMRTSTSVASGGADTVFAVGEYVWMGLHTLMEAAVSPSAKELHHD